MPTLTEQSAFQPVRRTLRPTGGDKAIAHLSDIMAAVAGTASGTDALTVLQEKLGEADVIGHGNTNPPLASETTPWIYINTADHTIRLKERSGNPGSYTYAWTEPVRPGDYQLRVIYHTAGNPPAPSISWNHVTAVFNVLGGNWTLDDTNARWMRVVVLPAESNTASVSPPLRIGDPGAADIDFTAKDGTGNLPASANNLQEVIDWLDTATLGGGGGTTQNAGQVPTSVTDFNQNLSAADTNVQLALNTIDELDVPPYFQSGDLHTDNDLNAVGDTYEEAFTIPQNLRDYRDRFDQPLFIAADANVELIQSVAVGQTIQFRVEILDTSMAQLTDRITATSDVLSGNNVNSVTENVRISGVLPDDFDGGHIRVTVTAAAGTPNPDAGVRYYNIEVFADSSAVDSSGFDGYLSKSDDTVQKVAEKLDDLEITGYYEQREDLNNITVRTRGGEAVPGASQQITIDPALVDEGGEDQQNALEITVAYNVAMIPSSLTGNLGTLNIRSTDNLDLGISYGSIQLPSSPSVGDTITVKGIIPYSSSIANTFYAVLNLEQRLTQIDVQLDQGYAFIERLKSVDADNVAIPLSSMSNPNDFIGGLRTAFGLMGIPDDPSDLRQLATKADYLFQRAFNPFQEAQNIDTGTGSGITKDIVVNSATDVFSNPITIPQELRDLSTDIDVRIRMRISSLGSDYVGNIILTSESTQTPLAGAGPQVINNTSFSTGDWVTFQRTIQAADVPVTFRIRFRRTSGTTPTTFTDGFADMIDSLGGGAMGGAGGQSGGYSEAIIYLAGAGINDRLNTQSESINRNLIAGHRFSAYDLIVFVVDAGPGATQPLMNLFTTSNLLLGTGATAGILDIQGNYWIMFSRQSDTEFRFRWGTPQTGLRRILGINTS